MKKSVNKVRKKLEKVLKKNVEKKLETSWKMGWKNLKKKIEKKKFKKIVFFFIFLNSFFLSSSPRSNVGRVSSLRSHYLCPNSKAAVLPTKGRYRAARAAKNVYFQCGFV